MAKNLFLLALAGFAFSSAFNCAPAAEAADAVTVALKSGETIDQQNLFWVVNCRSLLTGPMSVEMLDGPPELTASIRVQKIVPHIQNCANPVNAGVLVLSAAKDIKAKIVAKSVVRVNFPTPEGEKQKAFQYDVILVP